MIIFIPKDAGDVRSAIYRLSWRMIYSFSIVNENLLGKYARNEMILNYK